MNDRQRLIEIRKALDQAEVECVTGEGTWRDTCCRLMAAIRPLTFHISPESFYDLLKTIEDDTKKRWAIEDTHSWKYVCFPPGPTTCMWCQAHKEDPNLQPCTIVS